MKTTQILAHIRENGGFDNFRNWNKDQIAEWVQAYYDCSKYVANNVATYLT